MFSFKQPRLTSLQGCASWTECLLLYSLLRQVFNLLGKVCDQQRLINQYTHAVCSAFLIAINNIETNKLTSVCTSLVYIDYINCPKIGTPWAFCSIILKFEKTKNERTDFTTWWCVQKSSGRVANSVVPDQTAHHVIRVYTICSCISVPIFMILR